VIASLNDYILSASIESVEAREYWKKHFFNMNNAEMNDSTSFDLLSRILKKELILPHSEVNSDALYGLKALLLWDWNKEKVKAEEKKKINIHVFISLLFCVALLQSTKIHFITTVQSHHEAFWTFF